MVCSPPDFSVQGFLRQESRSGLPFTSSGDLPDPGIRPGSPALADRFFSTEPPGKPVLHLHSYQKKKKKIIAKKGIFLFENEKS